MQTSISTQFDIWQSTRKNIRKLIDGFSLEQLNKIPTGFSNNLIWNFGHVIVTHQLLVYGLSGHPMNIENKYIENYRKGTKPKSIIDQEEFNFLKNKFQELPEILKQDLQAGIFSGYEKYPTSYGFTLNSVEDAIQFNNIHEAMHYGTMLGIRKLL